MIKVYYSLTKLMKDNNIQIKGIGYISDKDLVTCAISNEKKTPYIRIYEDCLRYCNKIQDKTDQFKGMFTEYYKKDGNEYQSTYILWYKIINEEEPIE